METIIDRVSIAITSVGDGLEYDATVYLSDNFVSTPITHGFDSGYIFSNEEILMIALMEKYQDLARSASKALFPEERSTSYEARRAKESRLSK